MVRNYVGKNEFPRWVTQQTTPIAAANSDQIKVVSPSELEAASQMYGQVSNQAFRLSETISNQLRYIKPDYDALKSNEAYLTGVEASNKLLLDPKAAADGPSFRKEAAPIIEEATKGMGWFERSAARQLLNNHIVGISLDISERQVNNAALEVRKNNHETWETKQTGFLAQVNPNWTPDELNTFQANVQLERRKTLYDIGEDQHSVLDKKLSLDLEEASGINMLFMKNANGVEAYRDPGELSKIMHAPKFTAIFSDPEKYGRAMKVLDRVVKLNTTNEQFYEAMSEQAVAANYTNFIQKFDSISDPVKKQALYLQEKQKSRSFSTGYQRKIRAFGSSQYGEENIITSASKASDNAYYVKGANGDYTPQELATLVAQGRITKSQMNAFNSGFKLRNTAVKESEKTFSNEVQAELGIDLKPAKGKYGAVYDSLGSPEDKELKQYARNKISALNSEQLPPEQHQKKLTQIMQDLKQKRVTLDQRKLSTGNKRPEDQLMDDYAPKKP